MVSRGSVETRRGVGGGGGGGGWEMGDGRWEIWVWMSSWVV